MNRLLALPRKEQMQYFQEAAARSPNIKHPIIFEKDFWVCWVLEKIFFDQKLSSHITFKGGTSLSKCYGIINRFSEDCDLTLSKNYIGINDKDHPKLIATSNQRSKYLEKLSEAAKNKITHEIKPALAEIFRLDLADYFNVTQWRLETDVNDEQTLLFHYPSLFVNDPNAYIQSAIKLEFGARGDSNPSELKIISPYLHQILPEVFDSQPSIPVKVLAARRTFWEKVTLLHGEYHRDAKKILPNRMFRHYYDIVMLDQGMITSEALKDVSLLNDVVENKKRYFPSKWSCYEDAKIGGLRIYPNTNFIEPLRHDCRKMSEMFFGKPPVFEEIMFAIRRIENRINAKSVEVCYE